MAQCFAADGSPTTAQFVVPSYGDPTSFDPTVAMAPDGTFVIAWRGGDLDYSSGIQARMFSAAGVPLGDQFRVNALKDAYYITPSIGMRSTDKSFIVIWSEYNEDVHLSYGFVYGQRFNAAGTKVGASNFRICTSNTSWKQNGDVDVGDNGNSVVIWNSAQDGYYAAWAQRLDAFGNKIGSEFKVNTSQNTLSESVEPRVSVAGNGSFVAAWQRFTDASGYGIYARRYDSSGVAQGNDFLVNQHETNWQWRPDVACDANGNFAVVWQSYNNPDDPITSDYGIIARQYNAAGTATTNEYVVNNPNLEHRGILDQLSPAITRRSGDGKWTCAWYGYQGIAPSGGILGVWHSQVVGNPLPPIAWNLTAPLSGSYSTGTPVTVSWNASGCQSGYIVNLCYTTDPAWGGTPQWISVGEIPAVNGSSSWEWDTTGVPPGTYYIAGYIWNGSAPTYAHAGSTFIIT